LYPKYPILPEQKIDKPNNEVVVTLPGGSRDEFRVLSGCREFNAPLKPAGLNRLGKTFN
jgi:hypothetical protein